MDAEIEARINNAVEHIERKEFTLAKSILEDVLNNDPKHPIALHNMGELLYQMGQIPESNVFYENALKIKPDQVDSLFSLAMNATAMDNPRKALNYLQSALKIQPDSVDIQIEMSICYTTLKEYSEAARILNRLHKLHPTNDDILNRLGNFYYDQNRYHDAVIYYKKAIALNPVEEIYKNNLEFTLANINSEKNN